MSRVKAISIKAFYPGNKKFARQVIRAPRGKKFLPEGIEQVLLRTAGLIEKRFPTEEYHLVPVGPAAFNFVHAGPKEQPAAS